MKCIPLRAIQARVRWLAAGFAAIYLMTGGVASAVSLIVNPVDDRWALDAIAYDGVGAVLQPDDTFLQVGNAFFSFQAPVTGEYRAAMEFDLSAISGTVTSWTLQLTPAATQAITHLNVFGYFGDGTVDLSDMLQTSTLVASGTIPPFTSGVPQSLDVTSFVQSALGGGHDVLGFTLLNPQISANNPALYTQIASRNNPNVDWRPELIAVSTPEPGTLALALLGGLTLFGWRLKTRRNGNASRGVPFPVIACIAGSPGFHNRRFASELGASLPLVASRDNPFIAHNEGVCFPRHPQ